MPIASGAFGQRLGVVPSAPTSFTVSPAQQEQLDQLQRLLRQPDGDAADPRQPVGVQPVAGTVPAARPGMPLGTTDLRQGTVSVPTGAFGTVGGPTGAFGSTSVPETSGRAATTVPRP